MLKSPRVQPRLASMELRLWGQAPSGLLCISGSGARLQHMVVRIRIFVVVLSSLGKIVLHIPMCLPTLHNLGS